LPKPKGGVDLSNLGLKDLLFIAFHPRALQMLQMVQGFKQDQEDRAFNRAQIERQNQLQDVNTRLALDQAGGLPVEEGVVGDFRAAMGGGTKALETPVGRYSLPTQQKRQQQAYESYQAQEEAKAIALARAEGIKARAKAANEPKVPLAEDLRTFFKLGSVTELPVSVVEKMVTQYNAVKQPKDTVHIVSNNDGTMSVARAGATGTTVETVKGGPNKQTAEGGLTPYQQTRITQTARKDAGNALQDAQKLIDKARAVDVDKPVKGDPATDPEWQAARIAAENAATQHPDLVEAGTDGNGYPYVKWKTGPTATNPAAAPKVFPGSRLAEFAKKKGMDINTARKYISARGYTLDDNQ